MAAAELPFQACVQVQEKYQPRLNPSKIFISIGRSPFSFPLLFRYHFPPFSRFRRVL